MDMSAMYHDLMNMDLVSSAQLLDRLVAHGLPREGCPVLRMPVEYAPSGTSHSASVHSSPSDFGEQLDNLINTARTFSYDRAQVSVTADVGMLAAARAVDELRRRELLADTQRSSWWIPSQLTGAEWQLARKRLLLWGYPLRRFLASRPLRPFRRAIRDICSIIKRQVRSGRYLTI
jgi:hypothetical protein